MMLRCLCIIDDITLPPCCKINPIVYRRSNYDNINKVFFVKAIWNHALADWSFLPFSLLSPVILLSAGSNTITFVKAVHFRCKNWGRYRLMAPFIVMQVERLALIQRLSSKPVWFNSILAFGWCCIPPRVIIRAHFASMIHTWIMRGVKKFRKTQL